MRKNPHGKILKEEPKKQNLSTVPKSWYIYVYIYIYIVLFTYNHNKCLLIIIIIIYLIVPYKNTIIINIY